MMCSSHFRTGFLGKASPVHFFWGSFDLAVTRFSGRTAPPHPGGVPDLPDAVAREAYSHEVSSAGFWPGGGPIDYPAYYSYAYPAPEGFAPRRCGRTQAFWSKELGEFILPYDAVRTARRPGADADGVPAEHLRSRGGSGEVGSEGAGVRFGGGEGGAEGLAEPVGPFIRHDSLSRAHLCTQACSSLSRTSRATCCYSLQFVQGFHLPLSNDGH